MKKILRITVLAAGLLLLLASCRTQYHFPGGDPRRRTAPKNCGCPSYSWGGAASSTSTLSNPWTLKAEASDSDVAVANPPAWDSRR